MHQNDVAQAQIKDIIESACGNGAEMLVTPCPLCQANTEVYQGQINKKCGTKFSMRVLYYSQLMVLARRQRQEAALDGKVIRQATSAGSNSSSARRTCR